LKTKFGTMTCLTPSCGKTVIVRINENETLSTHCEECEASDYAKKDQPRHAAWLKVIKIIPGAAIKPAPAPAAIAKKKPAFLP
jgi:hypothetical protein